MLLTALTQRIGLITKNKLIEIHNICSVFVMNLELLIKNNIIIIISKINKKYKKRFKAELLVFTFLIRRHAKTKKLV